MGRPLNTPTKPKAHKRKLACTNPTLDHLKQNTQTRIPWLTSQRNNPNTNTRDGIPTPLGLTPLTPHSTLTHESLAKDNWG